MDIEIEDIAHGLARVARWNGQTLGEHPFSVAQHSLVVEAIVGELSPAIAPCWRLAALLHDAPEYVIGDMISPFKAALGLDYHAFEARLEAAVHLRFGLPARLPVDAKRLIKRADRASAFFEATQLAGFAAAEAARLFGRPTGSRPMALEPLAATACEAAYLHRFEVLAAGAGTAGGDQAFATE